MKHRVLSIVLLLAMMVMLVGCDFDLPFLSKPEDAVNEFMKQDNLMELISSFEESFTEEDDIFTKFWQEILITPSVKALLLDNVRSIAYNITNIETSGNTASLTVLIYYHDMSPVVDCALEIFVDKINEIDASGVEIPESDDEIAEMLLPIAIKSLKEATTKASPSETYTKLKFECEKSSSRKWELKEIPEEFIEKVLLLNFEYAIENGVKSIDEFN